MDTALWSMEWNTATEAPAVSIIPFITEMSYDLPTATLTVDFDLDLVNGDTVDIQALGIAEIDGELFGDSIQVTAAGDATVPTAQTFVQNRNLDPTGMTVDVTFSEDVEQTSAENTANWSVSGGPSVVSATRLTGLDLRPLRDRGPRGDDPDLVSGAHLPSQVGLVHLQQHDADQGHHDRDQQDHLATHRRLRSHALRPSTRLS